PRGPVPIQRSLVKESSSRRQKRRLRLRGFRREGIVPQSSAREGRQEGPGVQFEGALTELLPVNDPGTVAKVQDVAGIERSVHQPRSAFNLRAPEQRSRDGPRGAPERAGGRAGAGGRTAGRGPH